MKKFLLIIFVIILFNNLFAKGDYGTPGEFLVWGAGARSLGMGKAFTGLSDDATAIYYNPAGLAYQNPLQISLNHVMLFYDTMFDFAAITYPVSGIGTFGVAYTRLGSTGFEGRDIQWKPIGSFDLANQAVTLSYAKDIVSWLGIGINLKLISENIFDKNAIGYGADIGLMWVPSEYFSFGLSVINALPPSIKLNETAENFPIVIKSGFALKLFGERIIPVMDIEKELSKKDLKFKFGIEGYPLQNLALRAGMDETEITFGIGYTFMKYYKFDYSLSSQELGLSHRASFTLAFGGFDVNVTAEPKIFSPVGIKKTITISIYAVTKYPIKEWELNIINEDGDAIRTFSGDDKPPTSLIWDGKDDRGLPVGDGEYKIVMKVKDKNGKEIVSGAETVKISSTLPMQPGTIQLEE
jgi:hypothetical protein